MSDDEIQYIGTKNAQRAVPADNPFPIAHKMVTGITLHIEASNDQPAYGMVFRRCHFSVVNIGRRPGGPSVEKRFEPTNCGRAMFRCPVISRQHAKIAFSDGGHAYLIDLNSHHGTHVLKPGELVSKMLTPETPTVLAHGDVVTFGKSVGRDHQTVHPVVVRIGLLYDVQSEDPLSPSVALPSLTANFPSPSLTGDVTSPERANASKTPSGRYGVYVPSSQGSGSDNSSPSSGHDSDIEELEGPPSTASQALASVGSSQLERAFHVLKRLMSPLHNPSVIHVDSRSQSPSQRSISPLYDPYSPSLSLADPCSPFVPYGDLDDHPCSLDALDSPPYPHIGFDAYSNDVFEEQPRSRSTSPMEMSSPSPPPSAPQVVGSWEMSRSASPAGAGQPESTTVDPVVENTTTQDINNDSVAIAELAPSIPPMSPTSVEAVSSESRQPSQSPTADQDIQHESAEHDVPETEVPTSEPVLLDVEDSGEKLRSNVAALQSSLVSMRGAVSKLQLHRRKYKARFNANVRAIAEKLTDLDGRVADVTALWTSLADKLDNAIHLDIPDLNSAVDAMQDQISTMTATKAEVLSDREDVKASIGALNVLVAEMKTLHKTAEREMAAEVQAVKAARNSAVAAIAFQTQVCPAPEIIPSSPANTPQTSLNASLKRKRSDDDEGVSVSTGATGCNAVPCGETGDVATFNLVAPIATPSLGGLELPSPPKRARRILSTVVQTATAVTLGAVATWSALAFS